MKTSKYNCPPPSLKSIPFENGHDVTTYSMLIRTKTQVLLSVHRKFCAGLQKGAGTRTKRCVMISLPFSKWDRIPSLKCNVEIYKIKGCMEFVSQLTLFPLKKKTKKKKHVFRALSIFWFVPLVKDAPASPATLS